MFPVRLIKTSKLSSTTTQQHGISISPSSGGRGEEQELNCDFFTPYESGYLRAEPSSHNCFAMSFALRIYCQTQFVTAKRSVRVCASVCGGNLLLIEFAPVQPGPNLNAFIATNAVQMLRSTCSLSRATTTNRSCDALPGQGEAT